MQPARPGGGTHAARRAGSVCGRALYVVGITSTVANVTVCSWAACTWEEAWLCSQDTLSTRGFLFHCKGYILPAGIPVASAMHKLGISCFGCSQHLSRKILTPKFSLIDLTNPCAPREGFLGLSEAQ